ncbi:hypothetical protein CEXT_25541 [Caerostris extrusa]|uniref:Uncharacterized protein n=1 Tax=Caerostris extrusa TaxID=172846 RepID=A0AAV4Y5A9_CAEEX|nr:hypothetical protein CEXT_25541 [Caerostris extrusa]
MFSPTFLAKEKASSLGQVILHRLMNRASVSYFACVWVREMRPVSVIASEKGMACSLDNVKTAVGFGNVSSQEMTISDAVQWSERTEMVLGDFGLEYPIITNRTELRVSIDTNPYTTFPKE